jgi:hypothetical protein
MIALECHNKHAPRAMPGYDDIPVRTLPKIVAGKYK